MSKWETEEDRASFREIVHSQVRELRRAADDDNKGLFNPTSPEWPFVAILVAGLAGCVDVEAIAEGLEFEPDFVNEVVARLRANWLWTENEYAASADLTSDGGSDLDFYLHLNVAKGFSTRTQDARYAMTPAGIRHVEGMLGRYKK